MSIISLILAVIFLVNNGSSLFQSERSKQLEQELKESAQKVEETSAEVVKALAKDCQIVVMSCVNSAKDFKESCIANKARYYPKACDDPIIEQILAQESQARAAWETDVNTKMLDVIAVCTKSFIVPNCVETMHKIRNEDCVKLYVAACDDPRIAEVLEFGETYTDEALISERLDLCNLFNMCEGMEYVKQICSEPRAKYIPSCSKFLAVPEGPSTVQTESEGSSTETEASESEGSAVEQELQKVEVIPSNAKVNEKSAYTIKFAITTTSEPDLDSVEITFPEGFDVRNATVVNVDDGRYDNSLTRGKLIISGQTLIWDHDTAFRAACCIVVTIEVDNIINGNTTDNHLTVVVKNPVGTVIDSPTVVEFHLFN